VSERVDKLEREWDQHQRATNKELDGLEARIHDVEDRIEDLEDPTNGPREVSRGLRIGLVRHRSLPE
jgi:cell division protein FtsB